MHVHLQDNISLYNVYIVLHQSASQLLGIRQPKDLYYPCLFILFCPLILYYCVVSLYTKPPEACTHAQAKTNLWENTFDAYIVQPFPTISPRPLCPPSLLGSRPY